MNILEWLEFFGGKILDWISGKDYYRHKKRQYYKRKR